MAWTLSDVFFITLTVYDLDNNASTLQWYTPSSTLFGDIETWAQETLVPAATLLLDVKLGDLIISHHYVTDTPGVPTEASDVERYALFSFRGDDKRQTFTQGLPSIKNSYVVDGANILNMADPDVAAYVAAVIVSGPLSLLYATTSRGEPLTQIAKAAEKRHRRSSKG